MLLDGNATGGQRMVGRWDVGRGEAPRVVVDISLWFKTFGVLIIRCR
jgi:hypothetical protein